jgi:hypothetical protein
MPGVPAGFSGQPCCVAGRCSHPGRPRKCPSLADPPKAHGVWLLLRAEPSAAQTSCPTPPAPPRSRLLFDSVGGVADCQARRLRTICPPRESFQADPARILRGVRLAARAGECLGLGGGGGGTGGCGAEGICVSLQGVVWLVAGLERARGCVGVRRGQGSIPAAARQGSQCLPACLRPPLNRRATFDSPGPCRCVGPQGWSWTATQRRPWRSWWRRSRSCHRRAAAGTPPSSACPPAG